MAIRESELKQMRREIENLKRQVANLKRAHNGKARPRVKRAISASRKVNRALSENERALEIVRRAGLLSEPTEREKQRVTKWLAVPEEERKRLQQEYRTAKLDKMLSDIVIENRR
ncbi:MAG: hypothetical protein HY070_10860 [Chloroflexi bacterium]|nr:hypothetical protein [Chloroflexota bacterium]